LQYFRVVCFSEAELKQAAKNSYMEALSDLLTAAFLTGALFFTVLAGNAVPADFLSAVFLGLACFSAAASAARFNPHRFLVAAMILFMPSSLIRRFGVGGSGVAGAGGTDSPRVFAQRSCCASFIRLRTAALRFMPLRGEDPGVDAELGDVGRASIPSSPRKATKARSMAVFCRSSWLMMLVNPSVIC
jgi:hypothetical protein